MNMMTHLVWYDVGIDYDNNWSQYITDANKRLSDEERMQNETKWKKKIIVSDNLSSMWTLFIFHIHLFHSYVKKHANFAFTQNVIRFYRQRSEHRIKSNSSHNYRH